MAQVPDWKTALRLGSPFLLGERTCPGCQVTSSLSLKPWGQDILP